MDNQVIEEALPQALEFARRHATNSGEQEEMESIALEALVDAAAKYNAARGPFWPYARAIIHRRLHAYVRQVVHERPYGLMDEFKDSPFRGVGDVELTVAVRQILARYGIDHPAVVQALMGDGVYRDAAEKLGISRFALRRRLARAKRAMQALFV